MFKKTYGILYEQNAYVFTDLFKELENYYAKGTVSRSYSFAVISLPVIVFQRLFSHPPCPRPTRRPAAKLENEMVRSPIAA